MSENIIIVAIVCISTLGVSTIIAISTYRRDKFEFLSKTEYKDMKNEISLKSDNDTKK